MRKIQLFYIYFSIYFVYIFSSLPQSKQKTNKIAQQTVKNTTNEKKKDIKIPRHFFQITFTIHFLTYNFYFAIYSNYLIKSNNNKSDKSEGIGTGKIENMFFAAVFNCGM